ncbi:MarR family winged helix-turn-helix transcriptional regulator [Bosea sp. BH3]|uniref:MarR family winged helix-turn-helix transcriptional regulator n=1 Tax=Bosea sp. BH3 TaxID=2871701 RepID=UPI0021CB74E1|nr:MarR family transcriptional regulator [Bosea sp. BH3]MCU4180090.1 MarR family transcriptional regulator [Bosea sp. BH3]
MDRGKRTEDEAGRHRRSASSRTAPAEPQPVDLDGYVLEEQFGFLLRQLQQRYVAMFQQLMGEDGPTPPQFAALCRLAVGTRISQNQLGRMTAMDPATIRGVVTRLEERGLVERLHDPDDKRRVLVQLSPRGRELLPGYVVRAKAITIEAVKPVEAGEVEPLLDLMRGLIGNLQR